MRTLIILGHPSENSLCHAIAQQYAKGASEKGSEIKSLNVGSLHFNPNLKHGYNRNQNLEPDLVAAQELIKWASHLVFVYPVWWGGVPAILKGFIDRAFLPGFAYNTHEDLATIEGLLSDKTARLIVTSDSNSMWLHLNYLHPAVNMMKKSVLEFCGVESVSVSSFGGVRDASEKKVQGILYDAYRIGLDDN